MSGEFAGIDLLDVMDEAVNYNRFLLDEIVRFADGCQNVLDFGAGNGRFAAALRQMGYNVYAVEPDRRLRERLRELGIPAYERMEELPIAEFDYAFSLNVLEHVNDDVGVLKQLHQRLRPGGKLLIYVPAFAVLFSSNDARVGHVRRYSKGSLLPLIRAARFEIEAASYVDSLGFIAALVYRFLGDPSGNLTPRAVRAYDRWLFPLSLQLDKITGTAFGKNLLVRATKPSTAKQ